MLDINNIFVNVSELYRFNPVYYIDSITSNAWFWRSSILRAASAPGWRHLPVTDTHDHPISRYRPDLCMSMPCGGLGPLATLIEWDDNIPEFEVLAAAADEARRRSESALGREVVSAQSNVI